MKLSLIWFCTDTRQGCKFQVIFAAGPTRKRTQVVKCLEFQIYLFPISFRTFFIYCELMTWLVPQSISCLDVNRAPVHTDFFPGSHSTSAYTRWIMEEFTRKLTLTPHRSESRRMFVLFSSGFWYPKRKFHVRLLCCQGDGSIRRGSFTRWIAQICHILFI